jgi:hypothetical protein
MKKYAISLFLATGFFFSSLPATAQVKFPAPSPKAKVEQQVGLGTITVNYSRPGLKDRDVFGSLVPYGQIWRTGANAPTTITFSEDVTVEGTAVPKGTYVLATIPTEDEWTVILNKNAELKNFNEYDQAQDLARFQVEPLELSSPVETFTIDVGHLRDDSAVVTLTWGDVQVPLSVGLNTQAQVMQGIEKAMASGETQTAGVYANSAFYYLNNGGDLQQALQWMDKALELQPEAFYYAHRKALILAELGRKEEAKAEAMRSMKMAESVPAFREEYTWRNKQLIESL